MRAMSGTEFHVQSVTSRPDTTSYFNILGLLYYAACRSLNHNQKNLILYTVSAHSCAAQEPTIRIILLTCVLKCRIVSRDWNASQYAVSVSLLCCEAGSGMLCQRGWQLWTVNWYFSGYFLWPVAGQSPFQSLISLPVMQLYLLLL